MHFSFAFRRQAGSWVVGLMALLTFGRGAGEALADDLMALSLEELMNIEVTSPTKRPERLFDTAAAIHVITGEDIRRSGATSIPELLRMVPGVEVAQINAATWAVSARGFNSRFANKLLVLIDGRSVYTPLFSGVYWDRQDTLIEDIERIEVIRGPGASLWGANAVNGVINIITKRAAETRGGFVKFGAGTDGSRLATARYGGRIGEDADLRVYAKGFRWDGGPGDDGHEAADEWRGGRAGFRADGTAGTRNAWQIQGDVFRNDIPETYSLVIPGPPFSQDRDADPRSVGGYLLGRWEHERHDGSRFGIQSYIDHQEVDDPRISAEQTTFDVEFEHDLQIAARHRFVWGLGYRLWRDSLDGSFMVSFDDASETNHVVSAFAQDTVALVPEELEATLGTKVDYDPYAGVGIQPTARLLWHVDDANTVWAAVSRAVRTPSRVERDTRLNAQAIAPLSPENPSPLPAVVAAIGNRDVDAEELTAYEIGYRLEAGRIFSLDATAYYNAYDDLIGVRRDAVFASTSPSPHLVVPLLAANNVEGESYGLEAVGSWQVRPNWRLQLAYSLFKLNLFATDGSASPVIVGGEGSSPRHRAMLRSRTDLGDDVELDIALRYVDELPTGGIDSYLALDVRVGWEPLPGLELGIVGRNLTGDHFEFGQEVGLSTVPTRIDSSLFGTVRWSF